MRFVPSEDAAWRLDKISQELEGMTEEEQLEHPYSRYQMGATRFWLEDPELAPYIDMDANPEIWVLRTLTFQQRAEGHRLLRAADSLEAYAYAFLHGVKALEGVAEDDEEGQALAKVIEGLPAKRSAKHLDKLKDAVAGYALMAVRDVGVAVMNGSADLTAPEGKPFASPPGE